MKTMTKDEQLVMSQGVVSKWNKKIKALLVVKKRGKPLGLSSVITMLVVGNDEDAGEIKVF